MTRRIGGSPALRTKRYPDGCYAVVIGRKRGPCGHDKPTAIERYRRSGLIAAAQSDRKRD